MDVFLKYAKIRFARLCGFFAVLLWQEFQQTGNIKALETLLVYNIEDVVNLETLMVLAYNFYFHNQNS